MRAIVNAKDLKSVLRTAKKVCATKNTLPILQNVMLNVAYGRLTVTATDLEVSYRAALDAHEGSRPGSTTVECAALLDALGNPKQGAEASLELYPDGLGVTSPQGTAKLFTIPPDEFPKINFHPDTTDWNFSIPAHVLRRLLTTREFAGTSVTQYFLNGVFLHIMPDKLVCVATDSDTMGVVEHPAVVNKDNANLGCIIPLSACKIVDSMLPKKGGGMVGVSQFDNLVTFVFEGDQVLQTRLVDGEYPAYRQIIPKEQPHTAVFNRKELLDAVTAAIRTTNPELLTVRCDMKEGRVVVFSASDKGSTSNEIGVRASEPMLFGMNGEYFKRALNFLSSDDVALEYKEPLSAFLLRNEPADGRALALLMPAKLKE